MSKYTKKYEYKPKPPVEREVIEDLALINDERMAIAIRTAERIKAYRLRSQVQPVISIPVYWDPSLKAFVLGFYPVVQIGDKNGALINPSTEDTLKLVYDAVKSIVDDSVKGLLRSIGDAGANPANVTGYTVLQRLHEIWSHTAYTLPRLAYPCDGETYTTTPLGANAIYYSPARDFIYSRLSAMGVMGYADQPTATDGVQIQLSLDGTNWDYVGAKATLSGAGAVSLAQVVTARFARAVWKNGATAQTVFRFGGRYILAGSENPTISIKTIADPEPICKICGKDMTETSDFFNQNGIVYCPKCYANKRIKELPVKAKNEWIKQLKIQVKHTDKEQLDRVKLHIPDEVLKEIEVR